MAKERFNVESLDSIMKDHPEILVKYPQLKQIYSPNGKRYSFMERLRLKGQSSIKNIDEIYRDFDVYDFQTGEVEKIDIDRAPQRKLVEGEDSKFIFLFFPLGTPKIKEAVNDGNEDRGQHIRCLCFCESHHIRTDENNDRITDHADIRNERIR